MRSGAIKLYVAVAALAAISWLVSAGELRAQEKLRWKFNVGDKYDYSIVQDMNLGVTGGPVGKLNSTIHLEFLMTWDVLGVDEVSGEAVINHKFKQIKAKAMLPVGVVDYDSTSEEPLTGLTARVAPVFKAMAKSDFEVTMTARGEVKDIKLPEDFVTALKGSPGAAEMGELATEKGFKNMLGKGTLVLPEDAPKVGESWSTKGAMSTPVGGTSSVEMTYTFEGTKEIDGTKYAVFKPAMKMELSNPAANAAAAESGKPVPAPLVVSDQSSDGEVLFNISKSRLSTMNIQQKVTIAPKVQSKSPQEMTLDLKYESTLSPSGEGKDEAESAKASGEKG